jgi:hypothetical protein
MRFILRPALCLSLLAVAACDELAVANDPEALAELRGQKNCVKAVNAQTNSTAAVINTTIPVIETNYFIVDVPNAQSWNCVTDEKGAAIQIVERRA